MAEVHTTLVGGTPSLPCVVCRHHQNIISTSRLREDAPGDGICCARARGGGDGFPLVGGYLPVVCSKVLRQVFEGLLLLHLELFSDRLKSSTGKAVRYREAQYELHEGRDFLSFHSRWQAIEERKLTPYSNLGLSYR